MTSHPSAPFAPCALALCTLLLAGPSAAAGAVALLPDGVLTAGERAAVRQAVLDAGYALLEDDEVHAAIDGARGACAHEDVHCLAKIALLAEAEAVVSFARRELTVHVVAVDAGPRVGRATAEAAHVGRAVVDALAARAEERATDAHPVDPVVSAPVEAAPGVRAPDVARVEAAAVASAPVASAPGEARGAQDGVRIEGATAPPAPPTGLRALAGAGLAGAGLVALAAGGYAAVLAGGSIQEAEAARFQDDAARLGDTANGQLWLSGGAFALGVGAMAGGAALVFMGGDP